MGEMRIANTNLIGKPKEKSRCWKLKCRWKNNIKPDLEGVYENVDWISLAQDMYQLQGLVIK
jgi:hypothetical protein